MTTGSDGRLLSAVCVDEQPVLAVVFQAQFLNPNDGVGIVGRTFGAKPACSEQQTQNQGAHG